MSLSSQQPLLNIPIMALSAAGGKADRLEFQFCPLGVDKGLQFMFFVPSQLAEWYRLYSSLSCAASKIKLGCEPMSAKDERMGKGFWFLSTSLCDAMIDMVVGGIYNINSLCVSRMER